MAELQAVASKLLQAQNKNWARGSARTAIVLGGGVSGLATAWFLKKLRGDLVNVVVSVGRGCSKGGERTEAESRKQEVWQTETI